MTRVGIDAVDVARVESLYRRYGRRFLERLFTEAEIAYAECARGRRRFERLAVRFAAKEALVKAWGRPLPYRTIEVSRTPAGPLVRCPRVSGTITASLSHTEGLAVACVLLQEDEPSAAPRRAART